MLQPAAFLVLALMLSACFDLNPPATDAGAAPEPREVAERGDGEGAGGAQDAAADRASTRSAALPMIDGSGDVDVVEGPRRVVLPAGTTRKGAKDFVDLPPGDEYYLDYTMTFDDDFFFTLGGKLPGLAGGRATTGCSSTDPGGWSARLGWTTDGVGNLYIYDQHRDGKCGDNNFFPELSFDTGGTHRVTQWIKLNTPGRSDGAIKVWLDGELAIGLDDVELRGDVARDEARIDRLAYAVFSGGKDPKKFAPPHDQAIEFGPMHLLTCAPDFSTSTPTCASG